MSFNYFYLVSNSSYYDFSFERFIPSAGYRKVNFLLQSFKQRVVANIPRITIKASNSTDEHKANESINNDEEDDSGVAAFKAKGKGKLSWS